MIAEELIAKAGALLDELAGRGLLLVTAESCTGGLIAATLTGVAGSSRVVERGFVTYSNLAKTELLGVPSDLIEAQGAVSEAVARCMAKGALEAATATSVSVAVTGVAGPGGGSPEKPVGLVHLSAAQRLAAGDIMIVHRAYRFGDIGRDGVRFATVAAALDLIGDLIRQPG